MSLCNAMSHYRRTKETTATRAYFALLALVVIMPGWYTTLADARITLSFKNSFKPCQFTPETKDDDKVGQLACTRAQSHAFGSYLPKVNSGDYIITEIILQLTPAVTTCESYSYYYAPTVRSIHIEGAQLTKFDKYCFNGLNVLEELVIINGLPISQPGESLSSRLFTSSGELYYMQKLRQLTLQNIDLSEGLPAWSFYRLSERLVRVRLVGNLLASVHDTAFSRSSVRNSLVVLELEGQLSGRRLLETAAIWAKPLRALTNISFDNTPLKPGNTTGEATIAVSSIRLDFGKHVNAQLRWLSLQSCGLTELSEDASDSEDGGGGILDLSRVNERLEHLRIGRNNFKVADDGGSDTLAGLKRFVYLRVLQMDGNMRTLTRLPGWFGEPPALASLVELGVEASGVKRVTANGLPGRLRVLRLSANPLDSVSPDWAVGIHGLVSLHLNDIRLAAVRVGLHHADWRRALRPLAGSLCTVSLVGCQLDASALQPMARVGSSALGGLRLGLDSLVQLETILLMRNQIRQIPGSAFAGLTRVTTLVLHTNHLISVEELASDVSGGGNSLHRRRRSVENGRSGDMRLKHLDLRNNNLTTLDRCAPSLGFSRPLDDLLPVRPIWISPPDGPTATFRDGPLWKGGVSLTGNPFVCDCRMAWFRQYVDRMTASISEEVGMKRQLPRGYQQYLDEAINFQCKGANGLTNRYFLDLNSSDLHAMEVTQCRERPDVYRRSESSNASFIPCAQIQQLKSPTDFTISRPISVARFDVTTLTVWLAVKLDQLVTAWDRRRAQGDASDSSPYAAMRAEETIVYTHQTTDGGNTDVLARYAFDAAYWPSGRPEEAVVLDKVHNPSVDTTTNVYTFRIQPVRSNTAYTVCLRHHPGSTTGVTACQIMQPFYDVHEVGQSTRGPSSHRGGLGVWERFTISASIGAAAIVVLLMVCLLLICLYVRVRRRSQQNKARNGVTRPTGTGYTHGISHVANGPRIAGSSGCCLHHECRFLACARGQHISVDGGQTLHATLPSVAPNGQYARQEHQSDCLEAGNSEGMYSGYEMTTGTDDYARVNETSSADLSPMSGVSSRHTSSGGLLRHTRPPLTTPKRSPAFSGRGGNGSSQRATPCSATQVISSSAAGRGGQQRNSGGDINQTASPTPPVYIGGSQYALDRTSQPYANNSKQRATPHSARRVGHHRSLTETGIPPPPNAPLPPVPNNERVNRQQSNTAFPNARLLNAVGGNLSRSQMFMRANSQTDILNIADGQCRPKSITGESTEDGELLSSASPKAPERNRFGRSWHKLKRAVQRTGRSPPALPEQQQRPPSTNVTTNLITNQHPSMPNLPKPFWMMSREDQAAASGLDLTQIGQADEMMQVNSSDQARLAQKCPLLSDPYLPMAPSREDLLDFKLRELSDGGSQIGSPSFDLSGSAEDEYTKKPVAEFARTRTGGHLTRKPSRSAEVRQPAERPLPRVTSDVYSGSTYDDSNFRDYADLPSQPEPPPLPPPVSAKPRLSSIAKRSNGNEAKMPGKRKSPARGGLDFALNIDLPPPPPPPPKNAQPFRLPPISVAAIQNLRHVGQKSTAEAYHQPATGGDGISALADVKSKADAM